MYETTFYSFLWGPSFSAHFQPLADLHLAPFWETYVAKAHMTPKVAFEWGPEKGATFRTPLLGPVPAMEVTFARVTWGLQSSYM